MRPISIPVRRPIPRGCRRSRLHDHPVTVCARVTSAARQMVRSREEISTLDPCARWFDSRSRALGSPDATRAAPRAAQPFVSISGWDTSTRPGTRNSRNRVSCAVDARRHVASSRSWDGVARLCRARMISSSTTLRTREPVVSYHPTRIGCTRSPAVVTAGCGRRRGPIEPASRHVGIEVRAELATQTPARRPSRRAAASEGP